MVHLPIECPSGSGLELCARDKRWSLGPARGVTHCKKNHAVEVGILETEISVA